MLTQEQQAANYMTIRHIERVRNLINKFVKNLLDRGEVHDQSKMESPEVELFTEFTPKLAGTTFNSPEDIENKKKLSVALSHHYARNDHHPEHHKNGVDDMTLMSIVEMLIDWKASSERQNDGNILKSIQINCERYGMSPQLIRIFENTAKELFR